MALLLGGALAIAGGVLVKLFGDNNPNTVNQRVQNTINYTNVKNFLNVNQLTQSLVISNVQSCTINMDCYAIIGTTVSCEQMITNDTQVINSEILNINSEQFDQLTNALTDDINQSFYESDDVTSAAVEWLQTSNALSQTAINNINTSFETSFTVENILSNQQDFYNIQTNSINVHCVYAIDSSITGTQTINNRVVMGQTLSDTIDFITATFVENDVVNQFKQDYSSEAGIVNPSSVRTIVTVIIVVAVVIGVIIFLVIAGVVIWLIVRAMRGSARKKSSNISLPPVQQHPPPMAYPPPPPYGYPYPYMPPAPTVSHGGLPAFPQ